MTVEHRANVRSYFDSVAESYSRLAQSRLWSAVKAIESQRLLDLIPKTDRQRIRALELGAGTGYYSRALLKFPGLQLCALDFSPKMLERHPYPCEKITADIEDLPDTLRARSFDLVFCAGAFEFLGDPRRALVQLSQMQSRGAALVLSIPSRNIMTRVYGWFHRWHGVSIRRYSEEDIAALAAAAGYRVGRIRPVPPFNYGAQLIKL